MKNLIKLHSDIGELIDLIQAERTDQKSFQANILMSQINGQTALLETYRNRFAESKEKESTHLRKIESIIRRLYDELPNNSVTWRFKINGNEFDIITELQAEEMAKANPESMLMCIDENGDLLDEQLACDIFNFDYENPKNE